MFAIDRYGGGSAGSGSSIGGGGSPGDDPFGHYGPVTGIACHSNRDFGDLVLSSSFDRTVKLWQTSSSANTQSSSARALSCLASFEDFSDYVLDVAWSPSTPSMFASVDAGGLLSLWDLSADLEMPYVSVKPDPAVALNRLAWANHGPGKEQALAVGDDFGRVWLFDIKATEEGGRDADAAKRRKMGAALEEMRENMADLEARARANENFKKW